MNEPADNREIGVVLADDHVPTRAGIRLILEVSGFTTPSGERLTIFGEGGGQILADELDVPLLGKVPLSEPLREHADAGTPLVTAEPDSPASQAIRQAARGIVAATPQVAYDSAVAVMTAPLSTARTRAWLSPVDEIAPLRNRFGYHASTRCP